MLCFLKFFGLFDDFHSCLKGCDLNERKSFILITQVFCCKLPAVLMMDISFFPKRPCVTFCLLVSIPRIEHKDDDAADSLLLCNSVFVKFSGSEGTARF